MGGLFVVSPSLGVVLSRPQKHAGDDASAEEIISAMKTCVLADAPETAALLDAPFAPAAAVAREAALEAAAKAAALA